MGYLNVLPDDFLVNNARIIREGGKSQWVNLTSLCRNSIRYTVRATITPDLRLSCSANAKYYNEESFSRKVEYNSYDTEDELINDMERSMDIEIDEYTASGMRDYSPAAEENFTFTKDLDASGDMLYVNLYIPTFHSKDAFQSLTRTYPIDFPYSYKVTYAISIAIPDGYAVEERGFSYGCVKTKVSSRKWTHWFQLPFVDYGEATFTGGTYVKPDTAATEYTLGTRTLKNGSKGTDVKALQEFLLQLEYSLPKYGADGEFGSETETALKKFQSKIGIKQDGIYGSETHQALMDAVADDDEGKADAEPETETPEAAKPAVKQVRIVCGSGSVNIRVGNDTRYGRITSVKDGATFEWIATAENGWHAIVVNAQIGWVSGKYSQIV